MEQTITETPQAQNIYQSQVNLTLEKLASEIDNDNREAFHQGFIQGAEGMAYLLGQGMTTDEALAACRKHQFIKLLEDATDDTTEIPAEI